VALLLAAATLAACGGPPAPGASVPRRLTFIDAVAALPDDLDPSATPSAAGETILPSWSSGLVRPAGATPGPNAQLPAAGAVVPYLATSWQTAPGGDITFKLRHGVRGSTGDPFTAADVTWSIARDLAVVPAASYLFSLAHLDRADPVTVLGPYAVRFNVTAPSPFLLGVLASLEGAIYDRDLYLAHTTRSDPWGEAWGATNSATFGAYYVAEFLADRRIVLLRNPYAWDHPYYARVEIKEMPDSAHRLDAIFAGSIDHTSGLDWDDYESAITYGWANHVHASILQTGPGVESWFLDLAVAPFDRPDVRRALQIGIDRLEIAGQVWGGYAKPDLLALPAAYGQAQPGVGDVAAARRLLAAAGYAHGLTLPVYVPFDLGDGGQSYTLYLLRQQLAEIGITLEPTVFYDDDQLYALSAQHEVPSAIEDLTPLLPGAAFTLVTTDGSGALDPASPASDFRYDDRAVQALLGQLDDTPASASETSLLRRITALVDADVPTVNLFELPVQNVTRADIAGYAAYAVPVTYYEYLRPSR
jgi:ABC-type transport system substrate-binding protein